MSIVRLPMIGKTGTILDPGLTDQPDDGYSYVRNVRFRDGVAEQCYGTAQFGLTHTTAIHNLVYGQDTSYRYWVGCGLTKLYSSA